MTGLEERIKVGRIGVDRDGYMNIPVDRSTVLGNPFPKCRGRTRKQAISAYREFLEEECMNPDSRVFKRLLELVRYLQRGKRLNLQCWCTPKPCHAEVIRETVLVLEQFLEES